MTAGEKWFLVGLVVAFYLAWRWVKRQEAIGGARAAAMGNANAMVGIGQSVVSLLI